MASSASDLLKLELQATGENDGTWGTKLNTALGRLEESIAEITTISLSSSDYTLDDTQYAEHDDATPGQESHVAVVKCTGTLTANVNVNVPARNKIYWVWNATSGSFTVTFQVTGGGGAGIVVPQGTFMAVLSDGTNVEAMTPGTDADGSLRLLNGTAADPSAGFASDTDTGLYLIGAANLGITFAGVKGFDLSNGFMEIDGDAGGSIVRLQADANNDAVNADASLDFYIHGSKKWRLIADDSDVDRLKITDGADATAITVNDGTFNINALSNINAIEFGSGGPSTYHSVAFNINNNFASDPSLQANMAGPIARNGSNTNGNPVGYLFYHSAHDRFASIVYIASASGNPNMRFYGEDSSGTEVEGVNINFGVKDFHPGTDNLWDCGNATYRWDDIQATNGTIQTSDANEKVAESIVNSRLGRDFIMALTPREFQRINGNSGRTHYGLIAQEVKAVLDDLEIDTQDFAGYIKSDVMSSTDLDEDGNYVGYTKIGERLALRYEEFIAPIIATIQAQNADIENLKQRLSDAETSIKALQGA